MAKVDLIHYTGKGNPDLLYAAKLLAFTKGTRLNMAQSYEKIKDLSFFEIENEMKYMAATIPSSWEFVDCVFLISEVSRATAQQITRTRNASFAMQSQRVTDMSEVTWDYGKSEFNRSFEQAIANYSKEVKSGESLENARDLLPIGVHCNLVAKYNLRSLVELVRARDSLRVQQPYVDVVRQMKDQVCEVWPWVEPFFKNPQQMAIDLIEEVAKELKKLEATNGAMYNGLSGKLAKASDKLKK
jgi:thymidylate synthase ThyX